MTTVTWDRVCLTSLPFLWTLSQFMTVSHWTHSVLKFKRRLIEVPQRTSVYIFSQLDNVVKVHHEYLVSWTIYSRWWRAYCLRMVTRLYWCCLGLSFKQSTVHYLLTSMTLMLDSIISLTLLSSETKTGKALKMISYEISAWWGRRKMLVNLDKCKVLQVGTKTEMRGKKKMYIVMWRTWV